jgi:hypothetical protein
MTDLIKRLRDTASKGVSVWGDLQIEAAAEIERLRLDSVRLDYLDKMGSFHNGAHICCISGGLRTAIDFSRAASGANK